jgi:hypothetical protein
MHDEAYAMTMQNLDVTTSCMAAGARCEYRCEVRLDAWRRETRPSAILTCSRHADDMTESGACGYGE